MKPDEAVAVVQQAIDWICFSNKPLVGEAVRVLLDRYEAIVNGAWIPIEERVPLEGEVVEITRMPKVDRARYAPSRNQFFPWSLIDWPTQGTAEGTYSRLREAVTHWRRGPEPGGGAE